jgi:hypothetical protein
MKTMMLSKTGAVVLQASLLLGVTTVAQAQDQAAETYIYGTYQVCDLAKQDRADDIFAQLDKPILDAAVADKSITSYGYFAHHTGGRWRRASFTTGPSIEALLDAQKKMGDRADATNKKLGQEYAAICNAHDDYIWHRVAGNAGAVMPGSGGAAFSTYYVCDGVRETQADAIVKQVLAPMYDKMVAEGKLKNWGWLEHIVGGQFRRVATMGAADVKSLMAARAEIVEAMDNDIGNTFTEICDSHADYIWNVKHSAP